MKIMLVIELPRNIQKSFLKLPQISSYLSFSICAPIFLYLFLEQLLIKTELGVREVNNTSALKMVSQLRRKKKSISIFSKKSFIRVIFNKIRINSRFIIVCQITARNKYIFFSQMISNKNKNKQLRRKFIKKT